ncbi:MAG: hypothetical protein ACYSUY_04530 [Planctomycetota bacterium]|jgi:hypothetical protein
MSRKQVALTVVLAMTSAFVGGSLSSHFFLIQPASAEAPPQRRIVAREFRLVDYEGRTRALLQLEGKDAETTLTLFAQDRRPRIKFIVDGEGNASAHFWHGEAKGILGPNLRIDPSINFWDRNNELMRYSLSDTRSMKR